MRILASPVLLTLALGLACTEHQGLLTNDIVSYRISLTSPTALGTADQPLDEPNPHVVSFDITALGADGQVRTDYITTLKLWVFYLGGLSPVLDENGDANITLEGGEARNLTRTLPLAYGPTTIWLEDVRRNADGGIECWGPYPPTGGGPEHCSFATGASAVIHYRNPYLDEVQLPPDPLATDATSRSQLEGKAVYVDRPRDLDSVLVVTAAYAQAFTVTDTSPSAMAIGYNHLYVYSYSRAKRNDGTAIMAGDLVVSCPDGLCSGYLAGGVQEFVGFTELSFPVYNVSPPVDAAECRCGLSFRHDGSRCAEKVWAPCPEPIQMDPNWLRGVDDASYQNLEKLEAALVSLENPRVCSFSESDWSKYGQFTVDIGTGCSVSVASKGVVTGLDPQALEGERLGEVIGTLRNVSSSNLWIVYPRSDEDVSCGSATTGCSK
jgi:hypothetical protein